MLVYELRFRKLCDFVKNSLKFEIALHSAVKATLHRSVIRVLHGASFKFRDSSRRARLVLDQKLGLVIRRIPTLLSLHA
jgi:hypothetical protein